tara:strand:- start:1006 stop:1851 length:846 start_codon:yes stop_codon:yes gene_type:complete
VSHAPILVDTNWLHENLDKDQLLIVDATWYLPNVNRDGRAEYNQSHIPNTVFWDIDEISDPNSTLPHMLPPTKIFKKHMNSLGIQNNQHVIVYDNVKMMTSPRVWWTLRVFGHEKVSVLDGGLNKWKLEGRPTTAETTKTKVTEYNAQMNTNMVQSAQQISENLETSANQIIDARSSARYRGTAPEPRPECRAGHIPGSLNLPFDNLIDPVSGTLRTPDALREKFSEINLDDTRPVVTTCGSGVTACVLTLALNLIGRTDVTVYDGSWTEWGSRDDTPVET